MFSIAPLYALNLHYYVVQLPVVQLPEQKAGGTKDSLVLFHGIVGRRRKEYYLYDLLLKGESKERKPKK